MQLMRAKELVKNLSVETLDCGHWIPLESRDELAGLLKSFANEVATNCSDLRTSCVTVSW